MRIGEFTAFLGGEREVSGTNGDVAGAVLRAGSTAGRR